MDTHGKVCFATGRSTAVQNYLNKYWKKAFPSSSVYSLKCTAIINLVSVFYDLKVPRHPSSRTGPK